MFHYDVSIISCRLSSSARAYIPLGPMYIVSALEKAGYKAQLIDYQNFENANLFNVPAFVDAIESAKSDIVGISLFGDALPLVLASIRIYQAHFGEKTFILGGPGVNGNEISILKKFPEVHTLVRGEGENTLPQILHCLSTNTILRTPGVYTRDEKGNPFGNEPLRIKDINTIPWPDYNQIQAENYAQMSLVTSRGCPFDCSFCEIITMWGRSTSFRNIDDVVDELKKVKERTGHSTFDFIDDTFTLNKKRVLALCQAIIDTDLNINWSCFSRIDTIDEEMMDIMARAGCNSVFFGIDTGSELVWREINKRLSRQQVLEVVEKSLNYFSLTASYIWGYPDETYQDFTETISLAFEVAQIARQKPNFLTTQVHFLSPTKSTPIYQQHHEKLVFSESMPLEVCGAYELNAFQYHEGYELCLPFIKSDKELFAPYYYYDSPGLDQKWQAIRGGTKIVDAVIGQAVLSPNRQAIISQNVEQMQQAAGVDTIESVAAMYAFIKLSAIQSDQKITQIINTLPPLNLLPKLEMANLTF